MKKPKNNKKKGILLSVGVMLLIAVGIILWPFVFPIKVTDSDLPYEYTIYGTFIVITKYTGTEEDVIIPDTIFYRPVKQLGIIEDSYNKDAPFADNEVIKSVYIPDSVTYMCQGCFVRCKNLEEVRLSPNLQSIAGSTFRDCESLKRIEIPEGVKRIWSSAFRRCHDLEEVILPQSLEWIVGAAFMDCERLEYVDIPDGVEKISGDSFTGTAWEETWGEGATIAGKNVLLRYTGDEEIVEIPEGVEYIGSWAITEVPNMRTLILPESVKECDMYMLGYEDIPESAIVYVVVKNPDMIFGDEPYGTPIHTGDYEIRIVGEKGSTAETYVMNQGYYTFLESIPEE